MSEFRRLVESEIPHLRRYARALTRDPESADDLVQVSLLRGLVKEHLWQPGTSLRHWLFTVLHNLHVSEMRRSARERAGMSALDPAATTAMLPDPGAHARLLDLARAIARLPEGQRKVVLLVGLEGATYDEAAALLALPVGTVRSRLSRARDALRRHLGLADELAPPRLDLAA
ncbi:MAG TPA: sigma-70 family RNA polymerase sigma factor [Stellaceae bacterium]|nr:sigma-70 family RNA polymerase sigma factor [Stellaceae bacterium]